MIRMERRLEGRGEETGKWKTLAGLSRCPDGGMLWRPRS